MKYLLILLLSVTALSEEKPKVFTFVHPKAACTLVDGVLVLSKGWPFGSWESCSYAVLSAAQQLDAMKDDLLKQLAEEKAKPVPVCPSPTPKPGK